MNVDGSGDANLAVPPLALPFPITDDFNNNTRNVDLWSIIHDGTGGYVQWANSRLELTITADGAPTPDTGSGSNIGAHVGANCLLNGDFDAQVDYQLLTWPAGDSVNVGITAFFTVMVELPCAVGVNALTWNVSSRAMPTYEYRCKDCGEVIAWAESANGQPLALAMAEPRRQHVQSRLQETGVALDTETLKQGSPYKLVIRKPPDLAASRSARRRAWTDDLAALGLRSRRAQR